MPSNALYDALAVNPVVRIDLLSSPPHNSDVSTWETPSWPGYAPVLQVLPTRTVQGPANGLFWDFAVSWEVSSGLWPVWGVGLSLNGQGFAVSPFDEVKYATPSEPATVRLAGQLNCQL
jgi:hypothetical protein